jgi:hypothetical protein
VEPPVTQPEDSLLYEELIDTNRELVAINRQIAESLANLERLYAEDFRARQEAQRAMRTTLAGINRPVWNLLPTLMFPVALVVFYLLFRLL